MFRPKILAIFNSLINWIPKHQPQICLLIIGSNAGITGMTKEHLGLAIALGLPVVCVVTKIDQTSENIAKVSF